MGDEVEAVLLRATEKKLGEKTTKKSKKIIEFY